MKIIEQPWEKRNLDLDCYELVIEKNDTIADVDNAFSDNHLLNAEYITIRVPTGKMDIVYRLQELFCAFSEMNLSLQYNLPKIDITNYQCSAYGVYPERANEQKLQFILDTIKDGLINSDRISLDPKFSIKIAGNRYANWIGDEIQKGALTYIVKCNDKDAGFFILRQDHQKRFYSVIGGAFSEYNATGFGIILNQSLVVMLKEIGAKYLNTAVSSNNLPALQMHLVSGAMVINADYIFIKHSH